MKVKFSGGRDIERALKDLASNATKRNATLRALNHAAEPIRDEATRLAPEDRGELKASIKIGKAISAFQRMSKGDVVVTFVGIDESINKRLHIYAEIDEFGRVGQEPQPYMRPAWEQEKMTALDRLGPALWIEIDKAAERAARKAARGSI